MQTLPERGKKKKRGSFHYCQNWRIMYVHIMLSIRLTHLFPVNNLHDKEMNGAYLK